MSTDVQIQVQRALSAVDVPDQDIERMVAAILNEAVFDASGQKALGVNALTARVKVFDIFKAVTAAAGAVGAVITAATGFGLPAALSAIAALGSLQGIYKELSTDSGHVVLSLLDAPDRKRERGDLKQDLRTRDPGADLEAALSELSAVRAIRVESGFVRLQERVVIRT